MDFIYDNNSSPYAFIYDGTTYYYLLNLQGDVIRIVDESGATICTYTYDAWGRILYNSSNEIFQANPIRYRGYYYDTETKLYYLQSRYYDPAVKRFVNADGYASTGQGFVGYNMFAYCNNNPVCYYDSTGDYTLPHEDKYVHDQVLGDICASNSDLSMKHTLIKYTDDVGLIKGRYGFCDLYHTKTGEVWELKKDSNSRSCQTKNASAQLSKYVHGTLLKDRRLDLKKPDTTTVVIGHKQITRYSGNWIYNITYWYEGDGILRYRYDKQLNKKLVAVKLTIAAAIVASSVASPVASVGFVAALA